MYLVRHGETTSNVMRRIDTALPGAQLTDFGVRQAARFALDRPNVTGRSSVLFSSVARRAQQTAEVIGNLWGIEPVVAGGIHEVQAGDLEDRDDDEAYKLFGDIMEKWHRGHSSVELPGGESFDAVLSRYIPVIDNLACSYLSGADVRDVYVVSHGAAIRLIAAHLASVEPIFALRNHLPNTGLVELSYTPDNDEPRWAAHRWGKYTTPFGAEDGGTVIPLG